MTTPDPETVATALLMGADGPYEQGAVQLLTEHGRWLEREAFTSCCHFYERGDGHQAATVRWNEVGRLLASQEDRDAIGSPSSWVVLATAHVLATDTLNWHRLDRTNRLRVANAITGALTEPA